MRNFASPAATVDKAASSSSSSTDPQDDPYAALFFPFTKADQQAQPDFIISVLRKGTYVFAPLLIWWLGPRVLADPKRDLEAHNRKYVESFDK